MKVCPKDPEGHLTFLVSGIERHEWLVDGDGNWERNVGSCYDAEIAEGSLWECSTCGARAVEE